VVKNDSDFWESLTNREGKPVADVRVEGIMNEFPLDRPGISATIIFENTRKSQKKEGKDSRCGGGKVVSSTF